MGKYRRKSQRKNIIHYVPEQKAQRWNMCNQIAKHLYYSNLDNIRITDMLRSLIADEQNKRNSY